VVHVWDGRFFRLEAHLDRFAASLARLRLDPGYDRAQIEVILLGCVRHAGLRQAYVSMTCTRGRHVGQPVREGRLSDADLRRAAEVLVTSTAGGIMPVTILDGQPVGAGQPGPLTRQLRDRYWSCHADPAYATPVRCDEPD
jgi:branched-subunit amino acid aminotransferase/4-amino-4-deoxychorismate lyase